MRIIIEHEGATATCLYSVKRPEVQGDDILLPAARVDRQALDRWCWAAIAVSVLRYYRGETLGQEALAGRLLGFDCSDFGTDENLRERCNVEFALEEVLRSVGCYSHWSPGKPLFERIQFEINNANPLCCRINWYTGGAHYVLINGYRARDKVLYIEDPLHGPAVLSYEEFPAAYRGRGGAWTETYWTKDQHSV